ncbi:hypothetical protein CASFOL_015120 [Castilleja foliolosa]|uniref:SWIM-type domain-containing protein n=1 Tax=Castilleja foliolosa TaxID=1961234 RepID=A0ABD3DDQ5_9LAMI
MARRAHDGLQITPNYDEPTMFSLKIAHGGVINGRNYEGGSCDFFDHVDGDMLGLIELKDFAEQLGYDAVNLRFWHQFGENLETSAKLLETDVDVYSIIKYPPINGEVLIFFDHTDQSTQACLTQCSNFSKPIPSQPTPSSQPIPTNKPTDDDLYQKILETDYEMEEEDDSYHVDSDVAMEEDDDDLLYHNCVDTDVEGDSEIYADDLYQKILDVDLPEVDDEEYEYCTDGEYEEEDDVMYDKFVDSDASEMAEDDELYQRIIESDGDLDESDESFVGSDVDSAEDNKLYDKIVDSDVENKCDKLNDNDLKDALVHEQMIAKLTGDHEMEPNSSDEFESLPGSEEDGDCSFKFPKYNPLTEARKPDLKIGMIFRCKAEAKFAIQTYCFKRGMSIAFDRNDERRLRAVCRTEACEWKVYVSPMQHGKSWQLKVFNEEHVNCSWNYNNPSLKSTWVGMHYAKEFRNNPKLATTEFRSTVANKLKAAISKSQAYRAKKTVKKKLEGALKDQYSKLRDYCAELLRSNPGSTVVLKLAVDDNGSSTQVNQPLFMRLYICFEACKNRFQYCRKVVGVDGCFLKSTYGGQLLTAIGIDPNNNMFPIAWAVVEAENKEAWEWFLTLLEGDIGIVNPSSWTFMSDKQKGLIPAFENLFPTADNRFCVQHLHSNMKKDSFLGQAIKNTLWAAARAPRIEEHRLKMEKMKFLDKKAYDWLVQKPCKQWARSHFSELPKCDVLTNNMCESFNSLILPARDKPIITMLEAIRNIMMARMDNNREAAKKWDSVICPRIKKIIDKNEKEASELIPMRSDDWKFQITGANEQYNVNILEGSCTCRRWQLTGIPCRHAISAIWCRKEEPVWYVNKFYTVETYKMAYNGSILGINGPELWPIIDLPPPLPPHVLKKSGRPKKLRRRNPNEPPAAAPVSSSNPNRLKKVQRSLKCKTCGEFGHNSRRHKEKQPEETE